MSGCSPCGVLDMATILIGLDAILCFVIVLAAVDYLRAASFMDQPLLCVAFYMVAIGAFGVMVQVGTGVAPTIWSVMLHLGVTVYAAAHYPDIFQRNWHWSGQERRKARP